jgi:hypothetical protein
MAEQQDSRVGIPDGIEPKSKEAMLFALGKTLGVVTPAAKMAGISRQTHYDWLKDDAAYANLAQDMKSEALDFAETKLHQKIQGGDTTAIIFFLKTQGKERGYVERVENVKKNIHVKLKRGGE